MVNLPFVSCIMPTANRARFIPMAIAYFLRQDYPKKELIIVDDGDEAIAHLLHEDDSIRYIKLDTRNAVVGAKRNYACALSKGDIIIHWDDDDWYAPDWITYQVEVMLSTGADLCGLSSLYFYDPAIKKSWKYVYPQSERPWVGGATMAYKKSLWQMRPFSNMQVGEDNEFAWYSGGKLVAHPYVQGFVSILHNRNTSPKYTSDARWQPCTSSVIDGVLGEDFASYG